MFLLLAQMRVILDSFCLLFAFPALVLTLFSRLLHHPTHQFRPSSVQNKEKKHTFIFEYTPAATSQHHHPAPIMGKKKGKTTKNRETFRRADRQTRGTKLSAGTRARISPTHSANWQTNTQSGEHKAQHSQKSILCRNILKCVLQYN